MRRHTALPRPSTPFMIRCRPAPQSSRFLRRTLAKPPTRAVGHEDDVPRDAKSAIPSVCHASFNATAVPGNEDEGRDF